MLRNYTVLKQRPLKAGTGFAEPTQKHPDRIAIDDPAVSVMTDLERVTAVIIRPGDSIEEANARMIQRGVRMLLVVDPTRRVAGLITANDLLGEKPMQVIAERGGRRSDISVADIMSPQSRIEVLDMNDVKSAKVGHLLATLRDSGRQHAMVVDRDAKGEERVRGLFSLTQIARQLGVTVQTPQVARTFAEIESQLVH